MTLVVAIALVYGVVVLLVAWRQRDLLYHPPAGAPGAAPGEPVTFERGDVTLRGWVLAKGREHAVLYFGGNAERVAASGPALGPLVGDRALYLVDYRGYGGSGGEPEEEALREDALAVFDAIRARHRAVALLGRSLGSGLAAWVAARRPVERVALITPYDSVVEVAKEHFWWLPVSLLLRDRYEAWRWAPEITAPTLVLLAEHDRVIPRARALRLVEHLGAPAPEVVEVRGAGHDSISAHARFDESLRAFFRAR